MVTGTYRIHGLSPERYQPDLESAISFYTEDSQAQLQQTIQATIRQGNDFSLTLNLRRADGAVIRVVSTGRASMLGGELQSLSGAIFDLDAIERQRTEQKSTRDRLENVVRHSPFGLVMTDSETRIVLVNPSFCQMLGYTQEDLLGRKTVDLTHPDDAKTALQSKQALWSGKVERCDFEKRYRRRDGEYIWVHTALSLLRDEQGEPVDYIGQCEDITERKLKDEALFQAKELAQVTLACIADGVIRTDTGGLITYCNDAAARIVGSLPSELVGQYFADAVILLNPSNEQLLMDPVEYTLRTGFISRIPRFTSLRTATGSLRPISDSVAPLRSSDGTIMGAVFVFQDATEVQSFTEKLAFQATHDFLTGLPNRASCEEKLRLMMADPECNLRHHFLLFLDLDHFKIVNDTSGHDAGDTLVKEVSHLIRSILRTEDFFARFGGDEFIIILPHSTPEAAQRVAEKILGAMTRYRFAFGDRAYQISVSIGITQILGGEANLSQVLSQADSACYFAKSQGRGRYQVYSQYDPGISATHQDLGWSQRIHDGLERDGFRLFFQRIVDSDGNLIGVETLLRLRDREEGGYYPPAAFLPAADRMGLMPRIDRWVCERAVKLLRMSREDPALGLHIGGYLTVNLSARTLSNMEFARWLLALLDEANVSSRLRVEITETEKANWSPEELELISALRRRGIRVLLDDFGMGYNSFEVLKRVDLDGIKLDRQVVKDIETDPVDQSLAVASVNIARTMNLQLVAEGVETQETLDALKALGVVCFQGHLFHRAEPFPEDSFSGEMTAAGSSGYSTPQ